MGALAMTLFAVPALTAHGSALFDTDDGTYRTENVTSIEACSALCQEDPLCRGSITYQPDVTKPDAVCRLNNGKGAKPAFPSVPPAEWDLDTALADLNAYRASHDLNPVTLNTRLIKASDVHAADLAKHGIASHEGTDGSTHGQRVQTQGYTFTIAAENVATGQKSWPEVFKAWQESEGHNRNLLLPEATEFGIALVYEPDTLYTTYWAMLMAAPAPDLMASSTGN
jgi:uncharacterized protein YkwD